MHALALTGFTNRRKRHWNKPGASEEVATANASGEMVGDDMDDD